MALSFLADFSKHHTDLLHFTYHFGSFEAMYAHLFPANHVVSQVNDI